MDVVITDLNPRFKHEVAKEEGGEHIKYCFQCGTCTSGCPVSEIDSKYNPRRIIRMVILGMREQVLRSDFIWLCSTCYTCYERCPQDVRITEVMNALKNMAVREGYIHPAFRAQAELIGSHGRLYEVDEFTEEKREELGLARLSGDIAEVAEIFKVTGLADLLSAESQEPVSTASA
ncbi:MAG: 4Fe-4S dicluster domain-containing protein [Firmicutes bacterium]|nr:4Fe-4S dicluster domain-containing protein [Bacillota bacterium]